MKSKPKLIIDTREKKPIDFEAESAFEEVIFNKLDFGDYSLLGYENIICIERKSSVNELISNFTTQNERLSKEFDRMKNVKHKFIVIEEELRDILNPDKYYVAKTKRFKNKYSIPSIVMQNILMMMFEHNVHVIFAGTKGKNIIKGLLLKAYNDYQI